MGSSKFRWSLGTLDRVPLLIREEEIEAFYRSFFFFFAELLLIVFCIVYCFIYRNKDDISEFLNMCDYVINTLPSTPETRGMLSGDVLSACKEKVSVNMRESFIFCL